MLAESLKSKTQDAEVRVLCIIKGITHCDTIKNEEIRRELVIESILEYVERSQFRYFGHALGMDEQQYPHKFSLWQLRTYKATQER